MFLRPRRPFRHRLAAFSLAVWFVLLPLAYPRGAWATGAPVIVTEDIPARIREDVQHAMAESWGFQAQLALINALQFFGERFAYETAVWLASGGKAQSPLFNRDTALGFLADSALGAGLQFVDDMDKFAAGQLGFDGPFGVAQFICSPTIPSIKLSLKLGLADRLKPRQPLCTWSQLSGNWDAFTQGGFGATLSRSLSQTGIAFEPGQSDLSAGLELHIGLGEKQAQVAFTKLNESLANKGFRPLGEKISGLTKTPASVVEGTLTENVVKLPKDAKKTTAEQTSQALSAMDTFIPMLQAAGQALAVNFAVTLVSQTLQQQVLNKGFFLGDANAGLGGGDESAAPPAAREQQARTAFAELQRPRFVSSGDYDQLTEFASCDPQNRQLTACVIDEGFVQAVRRSQTGTPITVAEALAEGLLHRDWPFIRPATAKDQDPNCSKGPPTGGYCFSNLQKLRRARIIPIGWELAAAHEANGAGNPVTLGQVVDAFFRDGLDGTCGTGDAEESPFCGLIDPNWVLAYPIQQCLLRGHGEQLIEKGTNIRAESCVDAPSCLERDGEGKCVGGYGYCVREKNIWHLAGQSCPGQYASCRAFSSREGAALAVLTSTIDRSVCTAENAGCRWYATSRDAAGNWESGNRRYLNRLAEQCTEANEGCTELISVKSATVNLVSNPSFERNSDGAGSPDDWAFVGATTSTDGTRAADGSAAIRVTNVAYADRPILARIPFSGDQSYVLSASALREPGSGATPQLRVVLAFSDTLTGAGGSPPPVAGMRTTCTKGTAAAPEGGDNGNPNTIALYIDPGTATGYVRGSCAFVAPTTAKSAYVRIYSTDANPIWADAIQIEEGETPSAFHDGYDANAPRTYLKVASPDFRCYDVGGDGQLNTANDHASCPSFAAGCTEADVGCERFAPQDGSPTVNGQFSDIDRCPAACVGYAAFREVASAFDQKDTFDFFIPSTARQCSAAEVGCSEFTNMDALERGGEQREYFSQLRRCEKPSEATSATYYTWEGSDTQGYQLRSFVLQSSTADQNSAPLTYDGSASCETNYGKRVGDAEYDSVITLDCRAFYSQNGDINYRRLSRTILITDDCVRYRVSHQVDSGTCDFAGGTFSATAGCTIKGHRLESQQCQPASAGCRAYRGNAGGVIQTIVATDFESEVDGQFQQRWMLVGGGQPGTSLESLSVGGRSLQLTGDQIGLYRLRALQVGLTDAECTGQGGTFTAADAATLLSASDCAAVGGTHTPGVGMGTGTCSHTDFCTLPRLRAGGTYEAILIGKGTGAVTIGVRDVDAANAVITLVDQSVSLERRRATLSPTWRRVVLGPILLRADLRPTSAARLEIRAGSGATAFLDSVLFREVPQQTTVIKGSWQTPAICDRASIAENAAPLAQGMLGCRAYQKRDGGTETLRSFSRLCSEGVVGCTAFHDTRNSADLGSQTFNNPPSDPSELDDVTVPADAIRYLVDDRAKYCQAAAKGCARFGKPTLDRTDNRDDPPATDWADAFLLDQPDRYTGPGAILCEHPSLFCEEYRGQDGTVIYFKDPGNRTCEYRESVIMSGIPYSGWFRSGSDPPQACDPGLLIGGAQYGIWRNADPNYAGWSGLCQAGYDHCTEFVDPADQTPAHPNGQPYHAIRTTVDFASCQGGVSQKEGCVVLSDSSDPSTRFSAEASLGESDLRQGARVPAINCDANPAGCRRCVVPKRCRADDGHIQGTRAGEPSLPPGAPTTCLSDSDCGDGVPAGFRCRGGEVGQQCATNASCATFGIPGQAVCREFANDGNAIIKVQRDRSCGQWLACRSATEALEPGSNRLIEVCESIDLCESQRTAEGASTALRCERWVRGEETEGRILTRPLYQGRNRGWTGQDYSGYSVIGTYQAHDLVPVDISIRRGVIDQRLVRVDEKCWGPVFAPLTAGATAPRAVARSCSHPSSDGEEISDADGTCDGLRDNPATPVDEAADDPSDDIDQSKLPTWCGDDGNGVCVNHRCIYGVDGATVSGVGFAAGPDEDVALLVQCRVYPESDAPFSHTIGEYTPVTMQYDTDGDRNSDDSELIQVRTGSRQGFATANACLHGEGQCGCAYWKLKYGDQARYQSLSTTGSIPEGLCDGGFDLNGRPKAGVTSCLSNSECEDERDMSVAVARATARCDSDACRAQVPAVVDAQRQHGKCKTIDRRERFFGLTGICLERDQSISLGDDPTQHPCVSWYPVQQLAGGVDLYNQYERAGFHEEAQYCTDVTRYEHRKYVKGLSIGSCSMSAIIGICGLSGLAGPWNIAACIGGAVGGTALSAAIIAGFGGPVCPTGYEYSNIDVNWRAPWPFGSACIPLTFDIDTVCQPMGGVGWFPDASGVITDHDLPEEAPGPTGDEEQAFRCTRVLRLADIPDPLGMNNVAWTDRTRPVRNPEEETLVSRTQVADTQPEHPLRYGDSCSVFGRLAPYEPEDQVGADHSAKYWEIFPDTKSGLQSCELVPVSTDTPTAGPQLNVASGARHFENLLSTTVGSVATRTVGSLRGLFVDPRAQWNWQRTNVTRQCDTSIAVTAAAAVGAGDTGGLSRPMCTVEGSSDEACKTAAGTNYCRGVCRMVTGRCAVRTHTDTNAVDGTLLYNYTATGTVCTASGQCSDPDTHLENPASGGINATCFRAPGGTCSNDSSRSCGGNAHCTGGGTCTFTAVTGRCSNNQNTSCLLHADCRGSNWCVFPIWAGSDGQPRSCTSTIGSRTGCQLYTNTTDYPNGSSAEDIGQFQRPDGECRPGCWNLDNRGAYCADITAAAADQSCRIQGQCVRLDENASPETEGEFVPIPENNIDTWSDQQQAGTAGGIAAQPRVTSVRARPDATQGYEVVRLDQFSVNGQDPAPDGVDAPGGLATLQFFGWATRNQMPIVEVEIDWGDGTAHTLGRGKYQNHKPVCAVGDDLSVSPRRCGTERELTCDENHPCPAAAGSCGGDFCALGCTAPADCPSNLCDTSRGVCLRAGKRCLRDLNGTACTVDADCAGRGEVCIDVDSFTDNRPQVCTAETCSLGGATDYEGTCVGATSFGNFPDACSATPFTFRHTYRCGGVTDTDNWDPSKSGCTYVPRVKLKDNWGWCTGTPAGGGSPYGREFCDDLDLPFIPFDGEVIVRS